MSLSNLQSAIEQATSETHKREFEVGGQLLTFPRLSIGEQGRFEAFVRKDQQEKGVRGPQFSLAATRNKAAMAMSNVLTRAKREMEKLMEKEGEEPTVKTAEEARKWAERLQEDVMEQFAPYADRIFSGITRDHMLFGIAQSLIAENGKEVTYTILVDGKNEAITAPIDSEFVDKLFSNERGRVLENVFLWVVGLSEQAEAGKVELAPGMTLDDIAKKTIGDAENSDREQDGESITT